MSHCKVLLIDYEPKSIESTSRPLRAAGFLVEVAQDGQSGLEAFHRIKPDLVLVEAMLPKKHGFDVCQEIKGSDDGKNIPVVITTGVYRGRKYRDQALANFGCDEYLEKPIDEVELVKVCRRFVADVEATAPEAIDAAPLDLADLEALSADEISDRLDNLLADFGKAVDDVAADPDESQDTPTPPEGPDVEVTAEPVTDAVGVEIDALLDGAAVPPADPVEVEPPPAPPEDAAAIDEHVEVVEIDTVPDGEETAGPAAEGPVEVFDLDSEIAAADDAVVESTSEVAAAVSPQERPARSKRTWMIAAAAIVIIAAGIAGWFFIRGERSSSPEPVARQVAPKPVAPKPVAPTRLNPTPTTPVQDTEIVTPQASQDSTSAPSATPPERSRATATASQKSKATPPPAASWTTGSTSERPKPPVATASSTGTSSKPKSTGPAEPAPKSATPARTEPAVVESASTTPDPAAADVAVGAAAGAALATTAPDPVPARPSNPAPSVGVRNEPPAAGEDPVTTRPEPLSEPVVRVKAGALVPLIEVDRQPVAKRKVQPKYHAIARQLRQEGSVVVRILVDENGKVLETEIARGIPNSSLNESAAQALRKWTYEPAIKDGVPVKVWTTETVHFRL